ncbi:hypothetical protein HUA74_41625 [Myxococcus sp. CA051A]|uniref:DUF6748 domain-containing protein n=1 Tax=Myxococcus llanfairpwllgwyngyllgogerychwyrndrobwllllantysiliogogogochensis TaxID=2590453 RepID=A0A540X4U6_9BACT|nr:MULTISPECIES: DUF6748 domain-containing protein [Myxococcus]NTX05633.1 hypothetical protein [Myxococcus sp. CA040A]NTX10259.1 hypothetical protein [Myxococcus sp. CA056]NTX53179.1 hypothetical protein [Myxococcus sp. CA039A]NTX67169.1 hypothetical protein [Myxococcus sp. CA051A]TQF16273.1 hypothetical protein FJV41_09085 [Myxococcus llanfairpwllgwyngyllgogerychwyrndrobwllllantysiliogogogochensis]
MNVRPLLLAALALGFAAGCSKPSASSSTPSNEPGTPSGDSRQPSAETAAAPSGDQSGTPVAPPPTPGNGGEAKAGESAVYIVKDSGVRCFAPPCPTYNAVLADKPDMDAIPIHELDLSAVTGGNEQQMESLMQRTTAGGLKLRGSLETRPKAGPAGDATVLRASKLE